MHTRGFTLIELLVVVMIVAILTSIAMPQYRKAMDRAKASEATEMLPALFEARERWRIFKGYQWREGKLYNGEAEVNPNIKLLDVEFNGDIDGGKLFTNNFEYTLIDGQGAEGTASANQACVTAKPRWGQNRGLTGATIWYRGDKFSCTDASQGAGCDILSVSTDKDAQGNPVYRGCH